MVKDDLNFLECQQRSQRAIRDRYGHGHGHEHEHAHTNYNPFANQPSLSRFAPSRGANLGSNSGGDGRMPMANVKVNVAHRLHCDQVEVLALPVAAQCA